MTLVFFITCIPVEYLFLCICPWVILSALFIHIPSQAFELSDHNNCAGWDPSIPGLPGMHKHWEMLALRM